MTNAEKFHGFEAPKQNYSKLPHDFVNCLPMIDSLAELKVVLYVLRHTWGFSEYGKPKRITIDEFMDGRKRRNGSRMDQGTGLAKASVWDGLKRAVEHGFLLVEEDNTDLARQERYYCLNMSDVQDLNIGVQDLNIQGQDLNIGGLNIEHRSEKETKEKNQLTNTHLTLWEKTLELTRNQYKKVQYETWIAPTHPMHFDGKVLTVGAANSAACKWLHENFQEVVEDVLRVSVRFAVASAELAEAE